MAACRIRRVYVAGPMTAPTFLQYLTNVRRGIDFCAKLRARGFSPAPFWSDFVEVLCNPSVVTPDVLRDTNFPWLECAHVVTVLPNWDKSSGTRSELTFATSAGIPIYYRDKYDSDEALIQQLVDLNGGR
jgi:hypothetical protein